MDKYVPEPMTGKDIIDWINDHKLNDCPFYLQVGYLIEPLNRNDFVYHDDERCCDPYVCITRR